jgi:hypothetical protein
LIDELVGNFSGRMKLDLSVGEAALFFEPL